MAGYDDMTTAELRSAAAAMLAVVQRREAEEGARRAVDDAVQAYADTQGLTLLQAWRVLAPEGVDIPPDPAPEPVPNAPEYVAPTGTHDAYGKGDLVTFGGAVYECLIGACTWSPAAYPQAWKKVSA